MWIEIKNEFPKAGKIVRTKIDDRRGIRNEAYLIYDRGLWWLKDGSMYVYYTPTHWWKE